MNKNLGKKQKGDFVRIRGKMRPNHKNYMIFDICTIENEESYHLINVINLHESYFAEANEIIEHTAKPANVAWLMIKRAEKAMKERGLE